MRSNIKFSFAYQPLASLVIMRLNNQAQASKLLTRRFSTRKTYIHSGTCKCWGFFQSR